MVFNLAAVIKMSAKKRKYTEEYLQYGFTDAAVNGQVVPQCVIYMFKLKLIVMYFFLLTSTIEVSVNT